MSEQGCLERVLQVGSRHLPALQHESLLPPLFPHRQAMDNFLVTIALVDAVKYPVQALFAAAVELVAPGLAFGRFKLEPADPHSEQSNGRPAMLGAPGLEQGTGHAVQRSGAVGAGNQAAAAGHGLKASVTNFHYHRAGHQILRAQASRHAL